MERTKFIKWLDRFLEEKEIDLEETFEFTYNKDLHIFDYGYVVEHMKLTDREEQKVLKEKLVLIDLCNGDVKHFLRYLAKALV